MLLIPPNVCGLAREGLKERIIPFRSHKVYTLPIGIYPRQREAFKPKSRFAERLKANNQIS